MRVDWFGVSNLLVLDGSKDLRKSSDDSRASLASFYSAKSMAEPLVLRVMS